MNRGGSCWPLAIRLVLLLLLFSGSVARTETLRVASLDLKLAPPPTNQETLNRAAFTLRQLNPDVILLAGVKDWETCNALAEALKPAAYNVALCSSFRNAATGQAAKQQVSILAKQKPYFFWSEAWRTIQTNRLSSGGFAFAALQINKRRLGFYCVDMAGESFPSNAVQQLLEHAATVKKWEANSVQTVAVGGAFAAVQVSSQAPTAVELLKQNGLADACFDLPFVKAGAAGSRAATESMYLLVESSAFGLNPQEVSASGNLFLVSDLELDPEKVAAAWPGRAQESERRALARQGEESSAAAATTPKPALRVLPFSAWWAAVGAAVLILVLLIGSRRPRRHLALPRPAPPPLLSETNWTGTSSYTVVISPQPATKSTENQPQAAQSAQVLHLDPPLQTQSSPWPPNLLPTEAPERARFLSEFAAWLKQAFVGRLVSDRREMLEAQELAVQKARLVDERLARIEQQIQRQTQDYERRIEELTIELAAAKEENRELISARITQIKLEMAGVRAKVLAQAQAAQETR